METTGTQVPPAAPIPPGVTAGPVRNPVPYRGPINVRSHTVQDLAVVVPADTQREDILSGEFWVHVAHHMIQFCEIRVMWEDGSKLANIICLDVAGRFSIFKCLSYHELQVVESRAIGFQHNLELKQMGMKKWCIRDTITGQIYKEMIPTQKQGFTEIEDMIKARSR